MAVACSGKFGGWCCPILLNNGDGTFMASIYYDVEGSVSIFASDLNGDVHPDLAVANCKGGNVATLINNGDGTFQAPGFYYGVADLRPLSVFACDLDGDGDADLAVADANGVSILLNRSIVTAIDETEPEHLPSSFFLSQNYPNPFNPSTTIDLSA